MNIKAKKFSKLYPQTITATELITLISKVTTTDEVSEIIYIDDDESFLPYCVFIVEEDRNSLPVFAYGPKEGGDFLIEVFELLIVMPLLNEIKACNPMDITVKV